VKAACVHAPDALTLDRLTTAALLEWRASRTPNDVAARWYEQGNWQSITWRDYANRVARLARRLRALGCGRGTAVAIFAETSFEWALVDLATQSVGGVVVAVHPSYSADEVTHALHVSAATVIFVGGEAPHRTLADVLRTSGAAATIYSLDDRAGVPGVRSFRTLIEEPCGEDAAPDRQSIAVGEDDVATIVFTSGTSAMPKAVCLTHRNLVATALASFTHLRLPIEQPRSVHWLPFAHLFGRVGIYLDMVAGCRSTYSRGVRDLAVDLRIAQPHILCAVPKVLRRFESAVSRNVERLPRWRRMLFSAAMTAASWAVAARQTRFAIVAAPLHELLKKSIFTSVIDSFGSSLELIIVGSAPVDAKLCAFFEALGIVVCEGFGMTETSGVAFVNPYDRRRAGSVGTAIDTVRFKVQPDGELLLKGDSICRGYLDPAHNREAFTADGWFRTGDVVTVTPEQYVSVIGRKKDILITEGGENISPERVEAALAADPAIKDAALFGDGQPFLVAVLNVEESLARAGEAHAALQDIVAGANRGLAVFEQIRKYVIARQDFSVENGELTPTLKKRRNVILEHYRDEIEALYAGPGDQPAADTPVQSRPPVAVTLTASRCS
jgi:long-chain acyl-CoA synthetase